MTITESNYLFPPVPPEDIVVTQFYEHEQGTISADWPVNHDLGFKPTGVDVTDSGGTKHAPTWIEHVDLNNLILHFEFAFTGTSIHS